MPESKCHHPPQSKSECPVCGATLYTYRYPHPAVATDIAVFSIQADTDGVGLSSLKLLLIQRKLEPYKSRWALPGGFLEETETLDECAKRELRDETGLEPPFLQQCLISSALERDPRQRVISVAYTGLTLTTNLQLRAGSDAAAAKWVDVYRGIKLAELGLAFDHDAIVAAALDKLVTNLNDWEFICTLFPNGFTLRQYNEVYDAISAVPGDKRNLRARLTRWVDEGCLTISTLPKAARLDESGPGAKTKIFFVPKRRVR